jgi:hypothetical protein
MWGSSSLRRTHPWRFLAQNNKGGEMLTVRIGSGLALLLYGISLSAQEPLNNNSVLKMVKSGLGESIILDMIEKQPGRYAVSPDNLIELKKAGVSEKILDALVRQNAALAVPASVAIAPAPVTIENPLLTLQDGTPIRMRLNRNLSSADATTGEGIDFEVLDEVNVDGVVVVARSGTAIGTVTHAQHKRRMARGGKLDVTLDYVRLVNSEKAAIRGVKETSGGGHTGAMTGAIVATALVVWPAAPFFLFMHGKDTTIPKGTEITAYVNGDVKLKRASLIPNNDVPLPQALPVAVKAITTPPARTETNRNGTVPNLGSFTPTIASTGMVDVSFASTPAGALVWFSGMSFARTPFVTKLEPGKYPITMTLNGYSDWKGEISVEATKPSMVVGHMESR